MLIYLEIHVSVVRAPLYLIIDRKDEEHSSYSNVVVSISMMKMVRLP